MHKFIIYGLVDPFTNQCRYVGKSSSGLRRARNHFSPYVYDNTEKHTHVHKWVKVCISQGKQPIPVILQEYNSNSEALEGEKYWIQYFKDLGIPLTNITEGGGGSLGRRQTEDAKQRISKANKGRVKTPEECAAIKERAKRFPPSLRTPRNSPADRDERARIRGGRAFLVYKKDTNEFIGEWLSMGLCVEALRMKRASDVSAVLKGKQRSTHGYIFRYKE